MRRHGQSVEVAGVGVCREQLGRMESQGLWRQAEWGMRFRAAACKFCDFGTCHTVLSLWPKDMLHNPAKSQFPHLCVWGGTVLCGPQQY